MIEYRQDDQTIGYCPLCHEQLSNVTTDARGYCELHGWQFTDWTRRDGWPRNDRKRWYRHD